jgi:hypothetical protein
VFGRLSADGYVAPRGHGVFLSRFARSRRLQPAIGAREREECTDEDRAPSPRGYLAVILGFSMAAGGCSDGAAAVTGALGCSSGHRRCDLGWERWRLDGGGTGTSGGTASGGRS